MNYILGIGGYSHDSSAALLRDGAIVSAVQEERLTRIKHAGGFPYKAIDYCMKKEGIGPGDISAIAFYAKKSNWDGYLYSALKFSILNIGQTISHPKDFIRTVGYRVYKSLNFRMDFERFFYETRFPKKIFFAYDHHACHAASAYYTSPFNEALILCLDGGGDGKTTTAWIGRDNKLDEIKLGIRHPHSISLVYTRITRYLGFPSSGDEYKVMGLAAFGKPVYFDRLQDLVILKDDGTYKLNMKYFNYQYEFSLSRKFYEEFGPARNRGEKITEHHADMAASIQKLYEKVLLHLAVALKKRTGLKDLAIGGGSALNCKGNGRLFLERVFDNIFVPSSASDSGTSIGAALYHYNRTLELPRKGSVRTDGYGPEYSDEEILEEISRDGLKYERLDNPARRAAELIANGNIIGWFQGRMEFGPRALGYRSILADPRTKDTKDRINKTIKFREEFRPFAPSIMREFVKEYFNADAECPFMTYTLGVAPEKKDKIEAVVNADGTGRIQTVSKEDQPLYYELIHAFYKITGVPVLLNTSFNLSDEPIVCSPHDAIRTFYTCGMDALIIGKFMLKK